MKQSVLLVKLLSLGLTDLHNHTSDFQQVTKAKTSQLLWIFMETAEHAMWKEIFNKLTSWQKKSLNYLFFRLFCSSRISQSYIGFIATGDYDCCPQADSSSTLSDTIRAQEQCGILTILTISSSLWNGNPSE